MSSSQEKILRGEATRGDRGAYRKRDDGVSGSCVKAHSEP